MELIHGDFKRIKSVSPVRLSMVMGGHRFCYGYCWPTSVTADCVCTYWERISTSELSSTLHCVGTLLVAWSACSSAVAYGVNTTGLFHSRHDANSGTLSLCSAARDSQKTTEHCLCVHPRVTARPRFVLSCTSRSHRNRKILITIVPELTINLIPFHSNFSWTERDIIGLTICIAPSMFNNCINESIYNITHILRIYTYKSKQTIINTQGKKQLAYRFFLNYKRNIILMRTYHSYSINSCNKNMIYTFLQFTNIVVRQY